MNLASIRNVIVSKTARPALILSKHSPKILMAAGVVGVVGTVFLACRATLKTVEILDDHEKGLVDANAHAENEELQASELRKLQVQTAVRIVKAYAPAIGLGVLSIGALTGSHIILSRRNGALMTAYAGVSKAYDEYRKRVVAEYGDDVDKKFAIGAREVEVQEKTAEGTTKVTKETKVDGNTSASPYRFLFDPVNAPGKWSREPGRNAEILMLQQGYCNTQLKNCGHLFLNEVFDRLGMPRTKVGAVVGWVYRHDAEPKTGDNYVDFGIFREDIERAKAFVDGDEPSIWLDFNVDGVILDLI
jgi:hypothetical protein